MEKLVVFFYAIMQMSLITWLWMLMGIECKSRFFRGAVFILSAGITIWALIPELCISGDFQRYFIYLIVLIIGKLLFKKTLKEAFYDLFTIFIVLYCIQSLHLVFYKLMYPEFIDYKNNFKGPAVIVIINSSFFVFVVLSWYFRGIVDILLKFRDALQKTTVMVINIMLGILVIQFTWDFYIESIWNNLFLFFIGNWVIFICNFVGLKRSVDFIEQQKAIETYEQYYPIFSNIITELKGKQHEFNNHLNTIYGLIELGGKQWETEIKAYIESTREHTKDISYLIELDNRVLAAAVYSKMLDAVKKEISFDYYIYNNTKYPMADYELVEVLGNLLNNAFEAVAESCQKEKKVILRMWNEGQTSYIEIRNNGIPINSKNISDIFEKGFSTKGMNRGYGLHNVKTIVSRQKGKIEVFFEGEYTVFQILFFNKAV